MDLVALGDVERRLISPKQAFRVKVDLAHAAARALVGGSCAEHECMTMCSGCRGAWQVRADERVLAVEEEPRGQDINKEIT
jgi:hypothetical protein